METDIYDRLNARGLITSEEKIVYWMSKYKEAHHQLWQLKIAAQNVIEAYENRFESIYGGYSGPIDEKIKILDGVLKNE